MTATTFTQHELTGLGNRRNHRRSQYLSQTIYQVDVTGEENESATFEIMADTCAEATAAAEQMAMEVMSDIQYIQVTVLG